MISARADTAHSIVGQSPQILHIKGLVEKLSVSRSPVLLLGESGTGKEVIARALHDANPRGTFVPIDCGSLVGPLMESELFGHVKGAFTGAGEVKRGLIELANGGTAFFDEIGDLPLELQVKLLRLLQEREYRPVGSVHRQKVDLRVIAATHRDLAQEVERGRFRQDLFYRLNVITIRLPALRDRKEDVPLLVQRFLQNRAELPPSVMEALLEHEWPGNVRELHNCIERMVAISAGPELATCDLPSQVQNALQAKSASTTAAEQFSTSVAALDHAVQAGAGSRRIIPLYDLERQAILDALEFTKGDRGVAAHLLGIGRTTLYRKLKEYRFEDE